MKSFMRYDTIWLAVDCVTEHSDQGFYEWEKVTAIWSGQGPMPTYAKEPRTFISRRRQVKDFNGNPLEHPRYIN